MRLLRHGNDVVKSDLTNYELEVLVNTQGAAQCAELLDQSV